MPRTHQAKHTHSRRHNRSNQTRDNRVSLGPRDKPEDDSFGWQRGVAVLDDSFDGGGRSPPLSS